MPITVSNKDWCEIEKEFGPMLRAYINNQKVKYYHILKQVSCEFLTDKIVEYEDTYLSELIRCIRDLKMQHEASIQMDEYMEHDRINFEW